MVGGRFKYIEDSLRKSFAAVKRDITSIRKAQKLENKRLGNLLKDSKKQILKDLSKKISTFENISANKEHLDFLERRLDEIEETMFDLEDDVVNKKKIMSAIYSLKKEIARKQNLNELIREIKILRSDIENIKKSLSDFHREIKKYSYLKNAFLPRITFNKELKNIKENIDLFKKIKNSADILELRFDDMENKLVEMVTSKEFVKAKNIINASIREIGERVNGKNHILKEKKRAKVI